MIMFSGCGKHVSASRLGVSDKQKTYPTKAQELFMNQKSTSESLVGNRTLTK